MAQEQRRSKPKSKPHSPDFEPQICLVFPGSWMPMTLDIFRTRVPASLLDMLDDPSKQPTTPDPGFDVYHTKVPVDPIGTVTERFAQALRLEVPSQTGDGDQPGKAPQPKTPKRKKRPETDPSRKPKKGTGSC
ncbi:uncharacterized protein C8A04DRAFT_30458 [Dichotomopilus funicola]|uniref:Uncharacterized protein n=1 Tax=Dichotomopilus funicola TaxID=1934379 RepID=A0AAN6ZLQ5_9PEZI|nr:hypothetical protein C8A04DRAFT_30458 [Dichotomopilus funicola]